MAGQQDVSSIYAPAQHECNGSVGRRRLKFGNTRFWAPQTCSAAAISSLNTVAPLLSL